MKRGKVYKRERSTPFVSPNAPLDHVTVDMLFHQLQKKSIVYITGISQRLHDSMQTVSAGNHREAYKAKLKTELYLIYENDNFMACRGALTLFQYIMEHDILKQPWNNLQGTCTETLSLLNSLITTPMRTAESERYLKRGSRPFLWNTMRQDLLHALAIVMEKTYQKQS
ncbi:unnamed protein product [Merluccius merluccius]